MYANEEGIIDPTQEQQLLVNVPLNVAPKRYLYLKFWFYFGISLCNTELSGNPRNLLKRYSPRVSRRPSARPFLCCCEKG